MKNLDNTIDAPKKNIFANAVAAKPAKASKKPAKAEVVIEGLELVAALDAASKTIESLQKAARDQVNARVRNYFIENGAKSKRQPENFRGVEGEAEASCELRKRGTRSPLSEIERKFLDAKGIPFEKVSDVTETFIINPEYLEDSELMGRVGDVLSKVPNMPADFIQKQTGKTTFVVTDETVATVFSKPADILAEILGIVTVIALKPQTTLGVAEALKMIAELPNL
jgi:hypothetical protein